MVLYLLRMGIAPPFNWVLWHMGDHSRHHQAHIKLRIAQQKTGL